MSIGIIPKLLEVSRYLNIRLFNKNIIASKYLRISRSCDFRIFGKLQFQGNASISTGFMCGVAKDAEVHIGDNVYFGRNCIIASRKRVSIGDNTIFGPNVMVYDHDHAIIDGVVSHNKFSDAEIEIGSNCWIGAGVIILKGSKIGDGVIVGAGTVVKGVINSNTMIYNNQDIISRIIQK